MTKKELSERLFSLYEEVNPYNFADLLEPYSDDEEKAAELFKNDLVDDDNAGYVLDDLQSIMEDYDGNIRNEAAALYIAYKEMILSPVANVLNGDLNYRYQMLGRMKSDCDYFINRGRCEKHLWAGSICAQVDCMRAIYDTFTDDEKPEWITADMIATYGTRMYNAKQRERMAKDVYDLFTSFYGTYYFLDEKMPMLFNKDTKIIELSNSIPNNPAETICKIREMMNVVSSTSEFYRKAVSTIRQIRITCA